MSRPIHIQHVVLSLQPGGLENGVVNVVNGLNPSRFRSSVCCLKQAGEFTSRIQQERVQIHEMKLKGGNNYVLPLKLARLFRRTRTDIIHTRNPEAFFYGFLGARLAGVGSVIHSEHGRTFPDKSHRMFVQRLFTRFTDEVFAVSEQLKSDLVTHVGLPAPRIDVIYNGVNPDKFHGGDRTSVRRELGVRENGIVIGSVGRLAAVKNYGLLLQALPELLSSHDVTVMLVGDGPERRVLEALSDDLQIRQRVRFLGHRDDVSDLLAAMDIFVLPSHSEGMSNTLLEAMAAGVPVVASAVGGNTEIVRDQQDGLIFPPGDIERLGACLALLCRDGSYRQRLGRSGYERVLHAFSIRAMIDRYEELYIRVFGNAGRPQA
jgi:sugar transferase (PEP-CTERM/EpsH1 system associated)